MNFLICLVMILVTPNMFGFWPMCSVCVKASVLCPTMKREEKTHKLLKNGQQLHLVNYHSKQNQSRKVLDTSEVSQHYMNQSDKSSYFEISQLNLNSSGLYTCEVCAIYPPPISCKENSTAVVFTGMSTRKLTISTATSLHTILKFSLRN